MSDRLLPKVDENMQRAQRRDAACSGKFYFRKDVYPHDRSATNSVSSLHSGRSSPLDGSIPKQKKLANCFTPPGPPINGELQVPVKDEYEEMSTNEIINGKVSFYYVKHHLVLLGPTTGQGENFPGLLRLVSAYLDTLDIEAEALARIERYLDLIRRRADGQSLLHAALDF
jgi:glutamate--cysteine ligase catalytic subunit